MTPIAFPKPVSPSKEERRRNSLKRVWERKKAMIVGKGRKNARKGLKKGKKRLPTIRSLIGKADKVFASYIRNRDGNKCVLCGSTKSPTCGHLIKRGKKATRWDEVNCNCLCSGCNYKDNFEHDIYVIWFLREYGQTMYEDLLDRSKVLFKPTREYLLGVIEKYDVRKT